MSPGQCEAQAVLIASTIEWTARKWDGFCSPVSSNLPLVSAWTTRSGDKFLTRCNTSVFLSQQGFDQRNNRTTLYNQVRSVRKVTGRPPPWAPWADPNVHVLFFGWAELLSSPSGQVGEWAEGDRHGSACSFHHHSARLRSPQKVLLLLLLHSPSCYACPHGCSAPAEAAAHSWGERGCKPQTSVTRSQWLCQYSSSEPSMQNSNPLNRPVWKQSNLHNVQLLHQPFQTRCEAPKKGLSWFSTTSACEDTLISARQEDFSLNLASHDAST